MSTITLVLQDAEQQIFQKLLDIALRQAGLNAFDAVSHFMGRIAAAQHMAAQNVLTVNNAAAQPQSGTAPAPAQIHAPAQPANAGNASATASPANPTANAPAHQSVLSQLIGEIGGQSHAQTHSQPVAASSPSALQAPAASTSKSIPAPGAMASTSAAAIPAQPASAS
jgi:hypothetical protein